MSPSELRYWALAHRRAAALNPAVAAGVLRAFSIVRDSLSEAELARIIESGQIELLITRVFSEATFDRAFIPLRARLREATQQSFRYTVPSLPKGGKVKGEIAVQFDHLAPQVIEGIRSLETSVLTSLADDTKEAVRAFVENGLRDGINPRAIAREIRTVVGMSPTQAANAVKYEARLRGDAFLPAPAPLTAAERAALHQYTDLGAYKRINPALRGEGVLSDADQRLLADLDRAISKATKKAPVLYRGEPTGNAPLTGERAREALSAATNQTERDAIVRNLTEDWARKKYAIGDVISHPALVSTSEDLAAPLTHSLSRQTSGVVFKITDAHGLKVAGGDTRFDDEAEWILRRDSKFRILSVGRAEFEAPDGRMVERTVVTVAHEMPKATAANSLTEAQIQTRIAAYRRKAVAVNASAISRTATLEAFKTGQALAWRNADDAGIVPPGRLQKTWKGIMDDRERESHIAMEGETVPFDQPYSNGQDYPGQGEFNCRCLSLFRVA